VSAGPSPPAFTVPPYPYDGLAEIAALADAHPGGLVDLSVGTPCDPPADAVVAALASTGAERGYPSSVGTMPLRSAFVAWMHRRFGVTIDPSAVAACVGTKEFVASAAWFLRLRSPERDTVLGPAIAYPTYAMSAQLAGCRFVGVSTTVRGDLDLAAVAAGDAARALCLWVNSPANPTGALSDLGAAAAWGRARGVPVLSDECYAEFTWRGSPATVLQHGAAGVVALHSLSKRANLAGLRVGMYCGDAALVGYFSEVRKHAGLMVPGPVQAAAVVAWEDDDTVQVQRERYRRRLSWLGAALQRAGLEAVLPAGGFYLWVPVPAWAREGADAEGRRGAWMLAGALAEAGGVVVSPGEFFGADASEFVRVAAVQPDDRIELVAQRLAASTHEHLGAPRLAAGDAGRAAKASTDNLG
jgi:succinyldiaminopimelate transaminase